MTSTSNLARSKTSKRCPHGKAGASSPRPRRCAKGLTGDVKKLTNFTPEYRLRVGNYRVLFEVEGGVVIVYRVLHRKDAYQ